MAGNWYRLLYVALSFLCIILSFIFYNEAISDTDTMSKISYIGSSITIIAFIVAALEIVQLIANAKKIKDESLISLNEYKEKKRVELVNSSLTFINECNRYVISKEYKLSKSSFDMFCSNFNKISKEERAKCKNISDTMIRLLIINFSNLVLNNPEPIGNSMVSEVLSSLACITTDLHALSSITEC